jgi:CHAT domain-containing protein
MAAFVDGRLPQEQRTPFVRHLALCNECRDKYLRTREAGDQSSGPASRRMDWRAVSLICLVPIVIAAVVVIPRQSKAPTAIVSLESSAAAARFRAVEPRLSVSSTYRPLRRDSSGAAGQLAEINVDPARDPHLAGIVQLMSGNIRGALPFLEEPLRGPEGQVDFERAKSAEGLTDLASAYYEDGIREERPIALATAVEAAGRSIELAPRDPAPRYVYALALEALSLREDAIDAWKSYMALDPGSQWSIEARGHLSRLEASVPSDLRRSLLSAAKANDTATIHVLVAAEPLEARTYVEDELLPQWAEETLRADAGAPGTLTSARKIGKTIAGVSGDRTVIDCVNGIGVSHDLRAHAAAHLAYGKARAAYARVRDERARTAMLTAAAMLEALGSPLAARPMIFAAAITHYAGKNQEALDMLSRVLEHLRGKESAYPVAMGQALWTRGLIESIEARPHAALRSYLAARKYLVRTYESSNVAGVENGLATTYRYVGDTENDWTHQLFALRASAGGSVYMRRQFAVIDTAMASIDAKRLRLAALLVDRVQRNAEREHDPLFEATAMQIRSKIMTARRNGREALRQLDRAAAVIAAVQPTATTSRMAGDIALERSEAMINLDPAAAIESLSFARGRLKQLSLQDRQARIDYLAGRARERAGDAVGAEREFRAGVDEIERQRGHIDSDEERSTFTDTGRALFDSMIGLLVRRNATDEALSVARRARTIGLTSNGDEQAGDVSLSDDVRRTAQPQALLIEYYVLPDEIVIWTTERGKTHLLHQPISSTSLTERISANVTRIANCDRASDCVENSAALFDLLLRPLGEQLTSNEDIVIAPDAVLHQIPFAALYDRVMNRYVVEDHTVTITLGSAMAQEPVNIHSILVASAADPGGGLSPLNGVSAEARNAAGLFPNSKILEGSELTPERFLQSCSAYDAVHFAGHAIWNERRPRFAALRLAPSNEHVDGSLYAFEVAGHRFPQTRLVVLAGCDTARGRLAGVGLLSFARTFLAAGVPQVVGSLWPVDDQESVSIFNDFYASLARHASPAAALRAAQRAAISREGPAQWATFQLYARGNDKDREVNR